MLLSASSGHSLELLTPAPLTEMLGTGFLRKPPEMLQLPGLGWMMLVAVETAGPDPGTAAFSLHLVPAPLTYFAAGEHRMQENCSGGTGLFPAPVCSSPTFPRDQWACSLPPCVCHAQGVSLHGAPWDGTQYSGPGPPPLLQPPGGQIQPSLQELHGTACQLQATTSQESLLHWHHDFTQPVHHHRLS